MDSNMKTCKDRLKWISWNRQAGWVEMNRIRMDKWMNWDRWVGQLGMHG